MILNVPYIRESKQQDMVWIEYNNPIWYGLTTH